ncbi:sugar phosphate isomerase/epimerase, partial [Verrucomicrobia bacterium]|nr:sugar phosphate isomerase/epimerase [Verrucomicrobiota bacterium]
NSSTRRSFLGKMSLAGATMVSGAVNAIEPIKRSGSARLKLSLAAYSFRDYFKHYNRGTRKTVAPEDQQIEMADFIAYCAKHGCDGAELTSYFFPADAPDSYYLDLRRRAYLAGVEVSGTAVGNDFVLPKGKELDGQIATVKGWIDRASLLGAPHIRVFAGKVPKGQDATAMMPNCIQAMEECCDYAGKKGIFLGIENHGGLVAEVGPMLEIIKAVNSPWFGVNLDTGNFKTDDPYGDLKKIAPYAVNVQVKVEIQKRGKEREHADLGRLGAMLRDSGYQGYVVLEYEAKEDPFTAVPSYLEKLRVAMS